MPSSVRRFPGLGLAAAALTLTAGSAGAVPVVVTYVYFLEADEDPLGLDGAEVLWRVEFNTNFAGPGAVFAGGVVEIVNRPLGLPDLEGTFPPSNGVSVVAVNISDPGGPSGGGVGEDVLEVYPGATNLASTGLDWRIAGGEGQSRFGFPGDFFTGAPGTIADFNELENIPEGQFSPGVTRWGEIGTVTVDNREGFIILRSNTTGQDVIYRCRAARGFFGIGPQIYAQPEHVAVDAGQTIQLDARAITRGANTFITWSRNGEPLVNGGDISGADTLSLTITNADAEDIGVYTVEIVANGGTTTSEPAIVAVVP